MDLSMDEFRQVVREEFKKLIEDLILNDVYFTGLSLEQILSLAKKSIKLTTYNQDLEAENEKLRAEIEELKSV